MLLIMNIYNIGPLVGQKLVGAPIKSQKNVTHYGYLQHWSLSGSEVGRDKNKNIHFMKIFLLWAWQNRKRKQTYSISQNPKLMATRQQCLKTAS